MGLTVREADIERDADETVAFLRSNLADHGGREHYDWLYRQNPFGRARAWIATRESEGRAIGVAAAFPRPIDVDGRTLVGWVLGDFAIDPQHRTLGPALRLQRAVLDAVTAVPGSVVYDHPSASMLAVYRWMKIEPAGSVVRYAKPLGFEDRVPRNSVGRWIAGAAGATARFSDAVARPRSSVEATRLEGRFGSATTDLLARVSSVKRVAGIRTADYLNWRYLDTPNTPHEVVVVVGAGGVLHGYAVYRSQGRHAVLRDVLCDPGPDVVHALLRGVIREARGSGAQTLSAPVLESDPVVPALRRWGFHPRETAPFVVVSTVDGSLRQVVGQAANWRLMDGDRDV